MPIPWAGLCAVPQEARGDAFLLTSPAAAERGASSCSTGHRGLQRAAGCSATAFGVGNEILRARWKKWIGSMVTGMSVPWARDLCPSLGLLMDVPGPVNKWRKNMVLVAEKCLVTIWQPG